MDINGYLWHLCKQNNRCLYVSSMNTLVLAKNGSIKKLWGNVDLNEKEIIFISWNPSGSHWILLVVDLLQRNLLYLDPLEQPCLDTSLSVKAAKDLTNTLLKKKFNCFIVSVEARTRLIQQDLWSCGVFVCMYAKLLATGGDLCPSPYYLSNFRKEIFETLSGNCLKSKKGNKDKYFICDKAEHGDWIACTRCDQWMHCYCARTTKEEGEINDDFTCP